ncbi:MAG: efflux RND transporter periplasmic adaptor subunit [Deltaproteobacteria bacterium]|nr:MAG: efflux RND transporter periplasmic adaptor subunit [Deltaproteobacteria bacterium]
MARRSQLVVSVLVLLAGVAAAVGLVMARPQAAQTEPPERAVPVRVIEAHRGPSAVVLDLSGTVEPSRRADLQAEVSGRVVELAPELEPGVRVRKGDLLVRMDDARYRAAVAARRAQLAQAMVQVREEKTQRRIAEQEWKGVDLDEDAAAIALREPHLESARAGVASARAQLEAARRDLAATRITAPFDAVVLEKRVEIGEVVGPGVPILSLAGTEAAWVRLFLAADDLRWIRLPRDGEPGAAVRVVQPDGTERRGEVVHVLGSVERRGRQAQILVRVDRPFDPPEGASDGAMPLLDGTFVRAFVEGRRLDGVVELPARAVVEGDAVWVVGEGDRLVRKRVKIAFRARNRVLVAEGLEDGDRVVTTPLPTASEGMLVAPEPVADDEAPEAVEAAAPEGP